MNTFEIVPTSGVADITFVLARSSKLSLASLEELLLFFDALLEEGRSIVALDFSAVESAVPELLPFIQRQKRRFQETLHGDICVVGVSSAVKKLLLPQSDDVHLFPDYTSAINYLYWEYKGHFDTLLFTLPPQLELVPPTRQTVRSAILKHGYPSRTAFQIETIIDELCNNAIEHGIHGTSGSVEVAVAIGRNKIEVNVSNSIHILGSDVLSPDKPQEIEKKMKACTSHPSIDLDCTRGRGLALVKMLSDSFDIDSSDEGTCVHVIKNREGSRDANAN